MHGINSSLTIGFLRHGRAKRMVLGGVKSDIQNKTPAKRDILLALAQLSLDRLLLSRAYLRFTGQIESTRSNATTHL